MTAPVLLHRFDMTSLVESPGEFPVRRMVHETRIVTEPPALGSKIS